MQQSLKCIYSVATFYALFDNCLVTARFCHAISLRRHWVFKNNC